MVSASSKITVSGLCVTVSNTTSKVSLLAVITVSTFSSTTLTGAGFLMLSFVVLPQSITIDSTHWFPSEFKSTKSPVDSLNCFIADQISLYESIEIVALPSQFLKKSSKALIAFLCGMRLRADIDA